MMAKSPYAAQFLMPRRTLGQTHLVQFQDTSEAGYRLMGASIRDNILFSHEYDETFYNLVLDGACGSSRPYRFFDFIFLSIACALRPDLALLPNGDLTEVGEKGNVIIGTSMNCSYVDD
jgi:ATP-binding cassette subfamily C (CFTR/MRP) protein 1